MEGPTLARGYRLTVPGVWPLEDAFLSLTGVAQLVGCHPSKQKVEGLTPSQGTCLGCRFCRPSVRARARGNQSQFLALMFLLFLPPFPSLKINKQNL